MDDNRFTLLSLLVISLGIVFSIIFHWALSFCIKHCCKPRPGQTQEIQMHKNDGQSNDQHKLMIKNPPDERITP